MESINVNLDSWIIQDGNYDDFTVGQETTFALEFYPDGDLVRKNGSVASFVANGLLRYDVVAQVVHRTEEATVVDFGLMAYYETSTFEHKKGDWFEGTILLGVDPFTYSENLKDQPGFPWIKYTFRIDEILLNTTPWIENDRMRYRDESRVSFRSVQKTDAWNDDGGHGSYLLKCTIIDRSQR